MAGESASNRSFEHLPLPIELIEKVLAVQGLYRSTENAYDIIAANLKALKTMPHEVSAPEGYLFSIDGKLGEFSMGRYYEGGHGDGTNIVNPRTVQRADAEPFMAARILANSIRLYAISVDETTARTIDPRFDVLSYEPVPESED